MKNRKRLLALILAGFVSVTTAFQSTSTVAFATEGTEVAVTEASLEASSDEEVVVFDASSEATSEEASAEVTVDEAAPAIEQTDVATEGTPVEVKEEAVEPTEIKETEEVAAAAVTITSIKEVKEKASGEFTVKGVVNYVSGKNAYVQDDTGAICLYGITGLAVGNLVTAKGTFQDYNGLLELSGATLVENDNTNTLDYGFTTFDGDEIATLVANHDDYECMRVILKNVTVSSKADITKGKVTLASGDTTILVYDKNNVTKAFGELEEGTKVNVTAAVSDYKGIQIVLYSDATHEMVEVVKDEPVTPQPSQPVDPVVDDTVTMNIATFTGSDVSAFASDLVIYADGAAVNDGKNKDHEITAYQSGKQVSPVYTYKSGDNNVSILGSKGMTSGDYYLVTVTGKGYGLYKLTFSMKGSNTGAKNWTVAYSTDGENFSNIGDKFEVSTNWKEYTFSVPATVKHVDKLYFKIGPADSTSINGKTVASGGVNRFNPITITGSPVAAPDITASVSILPEEGETPFGQELTMSCATEGATILYSINDSEFAEYSDASKPVLTQDMFVTSSALDVVKKATVVAYATSEGRSDSVKKTFVYTQ